MKAVIMFLQAKINRIIEITRKNKQRINSPAEINFYSYLLKFLEGLKA
jgi:hypothetical protein